MIERLVVCLLLTGVIAVEHFHDLRLQRRRRIDDDVNLRLGSDAGQLAGDAEQSRKVDRRACDELRRQEQREHDREAKRRSSLCHRHNAPLLCGRRPPAAMSLGISPLGRGVEVAFWHHSETADEQDK